MGLLRSMGLDEDTANEIIAIFSELAQKADVILTLKKGTVAAR